MPASRRAPSRRTRSNAEKRIELVTLSADTEGDPTMDALLTAIQPFIGGMIETLGMAAQPTKNADGTFTPGDTQAAKTVLDFLGKALANRGDRHSQEVLQKIANIRKGALADALAEPDDVIRADT